MPSCRGETGQNQRERRPLPSRWRRPGLHSPGVGRCRPRSGGPRSRPASLFLLADRGQDNPLPQRAVRTARTGTTGPNRPVDTGRIELLAGSPYPCHGRDTALLTPIRSTRPAVNTHRRRRPPMTRGLYCRTTQGPPGSSPPAESRPCTRHRRRRAARAPVRPDQLQLLRAPLPPGPGARSFTGPRGEGWRAAPRHRVHCSPLPARSRGGRMAGRVKRGLNGR